MKDIPSKPNSSRHHPSINMRRRNYIMSDSSHKKSNQINSSLSDLRKDIDKSIIQIKNIPYITTESFSSENFKKELLPILEEGKKRTYSIENINNNIDDVRSEIINPVNKIIKESHKTNLWFTVFSLFIGIVGIVLTIHSYILTKDDTSLYNKTSQINKELSKINEELSKTNKTLITNIENIEELVRHERKIINIAEDENLHYIKMYKRSKLERFYIPNKEHLNSVFWGIIKILLIIVNTVLFGLSFMVLSKDERQVGIVSLFLLISLLSVTYFFV